MAENNDTDKRIGSIESRLNKVEEQSTKVNEELATIRDGQERSDMKIDDFINSFRVKFQEVADSNMVLREYLNTSNNQLLKLHDEMMAANKRSEDREDAAKQRDFDAKQREIERKYEADRRADEIKKVQWKQIATALGTGGVGYLIIQQLLQAIL